MNNVRAQIVNIPANESNKVYSNCTFDVLNFANDNSNDNIILLGCTFTQPQLIYGSNLSFIACDFQQGFTVDVGASGSISASKSGVVMDSTSNAHLFKRSANDNNIDYLNWQPITAYGTKWQSHAIIAISLDGKAVSMRGYFLSLEAANTDPMGYLPAACVPTSGTWGSTPCVRKNGVVLDFVSVGAGGGGFGMDQVAALDDIIYLDSVRYDLTGTTTYPPLFENLAKAKVVENV